MAVLIVGGGAAGMMAGIVLVRRGIQAEIFERNEKLGKKLFITGKGRCNLTNACSKEELLENVVGNPKFLYSSFSRFDNRQVMEFFEEAGCPLKVERGNRVFPVSDKSSDVIRALERELHRLGVKIHLNSRVAGLLVEERENPEKGEIGEIAQSSQNNKVLTKSGKSKKSEKTGKVKGILMEDGERILGEAVLVATGGLSYPTTGSTGDGYRFARECGLAVTETRPSLCPMYVREGFVREMAGLSLKNVRLTLTQGKKMLYSDFGEMMFTHEGITGPLVLTASARAGKALKKGGEISAFIDLKPALSLEQLDDRLLREFQQNLNRQFKNILPSLFPSSLCPVILRLGEIEGQTPVRDITRGQRLSFAELTKAFPFTVTGLGRFEEAVITSGGVKVGEVSPATMQAKKVEGLFFAGEVLDVDALTGGFNLQIAWSTGYAAGLGIKEYLEG